MHTHITGLALGLAIGLIDCAIFAMSGEQLPAALVAVAIAFWATVGWAIHVTPQGLPPLAKGISVAWLMNAPWFLEYIMLQGQAEMAVPMVVLATVFGAALGYLSNLIHKRSGVTEA